MSSGQNTTYRVELSARAELDLAEIYETINALESVAAANWYNGLETLIFSLEQLPERGKQTQEDRKLRQLLHGNKPHVYRIIYRIDKSLKAVRVLHIRHGARSAFQEDDLHIEN